VLSSSRLRAWLAMQVRPAVAMHLRLPNHHVHGLADVDVRHAVANRVDVDQSVIGYLAP
jgi:hypothetical protein